MAPCWKLCSRCENVSSTASEGVVAHAASARFDMQIICGESFCADSPVAADVELDSSCQTHDKGPAHSKLR